MLANALHRPGAGRCCMGRTEQRKRWWLPAFGRFSHYASDETTAPRLDKGDAVGRIRNAEGNGRRTGRKARRRRSLLVITVAGVLVGAAAAVATATTGTAAVAFEIQSLDGSGNNRPIRPGARSDSRTCGWRRPTTSTAAAGRSTALTPASS